MLVFSRDGSQIGVKPSIANALKFGKDYGMRISCRRAMKWQNKNKHQWSFTFWIQNDPVVNFYLKLTRNYIVSFI